MEIKRLSPELANDYLHFFDTTPHDDEIPEHRCYCVCWASTDCAGEDFSTAEKRRAIAERYVRQGHLQGYLAYEDGKPIGWCNANVRSECAKCASAVRFLPTLAEPAALRIKSVFCFTVAPAWRGKGIAGTLLEHVCQDAKREGFECVEAYPLHTEFNTQHDFMGPAAMYKKLGFHAHQDIGDRIIVRKIL